MIRKILICLMLYSLCSCSSFREMHFFSDGTPGLPNYYRLRVSGLSLFSSSRYLSGYYDPSAVNQYFNEIRQPTKARLNISGVTKIKPISTPNDGSTEAATVLQADLPSAEGNEAERLVLIYSTNSDAVSNQIGLITENEATMDALAYLLYDDRSKDLSEQQVKNAVNESRGKLLVSLGEPLVNQLTTNDPKTKVVSSLLQYINTLALEMGNPTPFSNFEEAEKWLDRNRSRILNAKN